MSDVPARRIQLFVKHGLDRFAAVLLLILLGPLFALIATLIKVEDRGPIFYRQIRAGRYRAPFRIIKFRTMIPDADAFLDKEGRPVRDRVTRIGRPLRRWSLDELPQLINVVRGEMSLVGPRPVPVEYAERMTDRQRGRFAMRPGITGLAQIRGRHKAVWSQRIEWDLEYVATFTLMLDLKIIVLTARAVSASDTLIDRGDPRKVDLG